MSSWPDVRQCLIYDSPAPNARLIGVEYMISAGLFKTLDADERKLWHSHVFEVKSGMLIMPGPNGLPTGIWEAAETKEMEQVVGLYGKTYHFWQVDRGDKLPLGGPELMMSFTQEEQQPGLKELIGDRDTRFGIDSQQKKEKRDYIEEPEIHTGIPPKPQETVADFVQMPTAYGNRKVREEPECSSDVPNLYSKLLAFLEAWNCTL